ncbi:MFS transporter [Neobacillus mesonae]|uniref:MFS transporter n=1 Tax=Neobacillus mesonae TaxID=1193713 RepID=A0A3T0HX93_9BACI|nr:MFS transporter [Neobacillus mesonae]AZU61618.1 MFS transporter [Neobacillus mesonae]
MNELSMSNQGKKNELELRNLYLYSAGKTVSSFGTTIYQFALGLYVLKQTGSALSFALTLILGIIPMIIINPFAGVLADKINKKRLVVSMDFVNGMLFISVYLLSQFFGLSLFLIYSTTFLMTVFSTFFGVAIEAGKPNIVSEQNLMRINSISKIIDSVSSITGPMLGGIVFAIFDIKTFIIITGITFILSGVSLLFIQFDLFKRKIMDHVPSKKIQFLKDIKDGLSYLIQRKNIMKLFVLLISLNFFLGFSITIPMPYIINTVLKLGPKEFGVIQAAFPVGMIIGAMVVKKVIKNISYSLLLKYISFSLSFLLIIAGIPLLFGELKLIPGFYLTFYCSVMFLLGVAVALIDIPIAFIMQKEIPDEYRGRVLSIGISIAKTMLPAAMITAGVLLNHIPAYALPIGGGILFLLFNIGSPTRAQIELTQKV